MHIMGVFVLDASTANDGYSYQRVLGLIEQRAPDLAPFVPMRRPRAPTSMALLAHAVSRLPKDPHASEVSCAM
jgi:hypothetical protein